MTNNKKINEFIQKHKRIDAFIQKHKKGILVFTYIFSVVVVLWIILYIIYYEFDKYPVPKLFSFATRPDIEPKDWLTFWGSFFSFIGTMTLGIVAFTQNERLNQKNRKLEEYKFAQENCSIIYPRNLTRMRLFNVTEKVVQDMNFYFHNRFSTVNLAPFNNKISNMYEHIINNKDDYICISTEIYFINDKINRAESFTVDYFGFGFIYPEHGMDRFIMSVTANDIYNDKKKGMILDAFSIKEREKVETDKTEQYFKIEFNLYLDKKIYTESFFSTDFGFEFNYRLTIENGLNISSAFQIKSIISTNGGLINEDFEKVSYKYLEDISRVSKIKAYIENG
ncbi:MAG: hypothetical protein P4L59_12490 [Desulfosporosinus sp.]|nr:hypothetical protein [Desulfosporosinus sp.]